MQENDAGAINNSSKRRNAKKASAKEKTKVEIWLQSISQWPSDEMFEHYVATSVSINDRTYFRDEFATKQDAVKRLQGIALRINEKNLSTKGKATFTRDEQKFWTDHLVQILSCVKVSDDSILLQQADKIFKLPANRIDKHFKVFIRHP